MGLKTYQAKRNFKRTPEPKGKQRSKKSRGKRSFVIQKHAATRLHYDFRLELDGVLKSWAIPKGPSNDPGAKRLAVQVEDHPIEYGGFEGTIPEGEYGGGAVMLWEKGTWESLEPNPSAALGKGKLKFILNGKRLQGGWTLVRMGGDAGDGGKNWLLIKEKDEFADPGNPEGLVNDYDTSVKSKRTMDAIRGARRTKKSVWSSSHGASPPAGKILRKKKPAPARKPAGPAPKIDISALSGAKRKSMPKTLVPELATLVDAPPQGEDWLHEIKLDGYRIIAFARGTEVTLMSRNARDWTATFQQIADELAAMRLPSAILDGEVVVVSDDGRMSFQHLQNHVKLGVSANLVYYVFDLPYLNGFDLAAVPLLDRKSTLKSLLSGKSRPRVRYCEHVQGAGAEFFQHACRLALEGVISKKIDSRYVPRRSHDWLKSKCLQRQEFVIGGFTRPAGAREHFGALLLGYHENGALRYSGKVGTGFSDLSLADIHASLAKLKTTGCPFDPLPPRPEARGATWVKPKLVAEVSFTEWTGDGRLRHPSFHGLRSDKSAAAIVREKPEPVKHAQADTHRTKSASPRNRNGADTVAGQRLTHPDRVMYPGQRITKRALAEYYERIQDWVLPHVIDRPLSILRCPEGIAKPCFFQKHKTEGVPESIDFVAIREKHSEGDYLVVHDLAGLIGLVQIGALEIHPWGCKTDKIEFPDRMIFDLDPDPGVSWDLVKKGATDLRTILDAAGFESFLKTSGGKGLHIVVPLARKNSWDEVKAFTLAIARGMARSAPQRYLATMSKAKRKGKIFVDYVRNARGQTSVAPYSTRAKDGAPVSLPIRWEELTKLESAQAFTVANTPERLARLKKDPWGKVDSFRQTISKRLLRTLDVE